MSIAKQAARGIAWNMVLGVGSRVLQLVGTLILTRFIAPAEYGDVLAASITVQSVGSLTSFAFGQYLIARKATAEVAFQAMVLHFLFGAIAMVAVVLVREPLGALVDAPAMGKYVLGYAIAQMIDRTRYIPERLIMRALKFRTIAGVTAVGKLAFTGTALALAKSWGAYAVMTGALAEAAITAILFFWATDRHEWLAPTRLRRQDVLDLMKYGTPIMIAIIADRAATRWDNLIVSSMFDSAVMARYNLAYSLAEMPVVNIAEQIGEVLMPSFARMEDAQRRRAVVRTPLLMGVLVTPLGVGLSAVAQTTVDTFFDARWSAMAPMLAILSVMTVFRPMTWSAIAYVQAVQKTRLVMYASALRAVVVLSLVAIFGAVGGVVWACAGACVGYTLHAIFTIVACGRLTDFSVRDYLIGAARPLLPCIPMYLAVVGVQYALTNAGVPNLVSLVAQLLTGVVVYIVAAFVFVRSACNDILRLGREALRKRRS
jgi:lipopolysaccharide exporter